MRITILHRFNINMGYGGESWIRDFVMGFPGENQFRVVTTSNGPRNVGFKDFLLRNNVEVEEMQNLVRRFPVFLPRKMRRLIHLVKTSDVIYMLGFPLLMKFLVLALKKMYSVPVIRGFHSPVFGDWHEPDRLPRKLFYFGILEPIHLSIDRKFDFIHVLNSESKKILEEYAEVSPVVIPNGIYTERYSAEDKYPVFTILFLGRLSYQKGADILPELVKRLESLNLEYNLKIAGRTGERFGTILEPVRRNNRVEFLGFVGDAKKKELLARSHVLISPTRYEGFPLTLLESMASGTPVVAFRVPGPSGIIEDGKNGFLVESAGDMAESVARIRKAFDEGEYGRFVSSALETSSIYDWSNIFPRFEELFSKAAGVGQEAIEVPSIKSSIRRD